MVHVKPPGRPVVVTVAETGSTQEDLRALAGDPAGWPHLSGLRAVRQTAGRGRGERPWDTDQLDALTATLVLRPALAVAHWPWLPLLAGCAVVDALAPPAQSGADAARATPGLKWPNDVVLPERTQTEGWGRWRKVGGILAEVLPEQAGVLVGIGINVSGTPPVPWATTLHRHGIAADPDQLLEAVRTRLGEALVGDPMGWRDAVERRCVSIGARVVAHLPGGTRERGTAVAIDEHGGLVIQTDAGARRTVMAGDIEHLRVDAGAGG